MAIITFSQDIVTLPFRNYTSETAIYQTITEFKVNTMRLLAIALTLLLVACSGTTKSPPEEAKNTLPPEQSATILKSGLPGVLSSTYARVVRVDDATFFRVDKVIIQGGPHRLQIECKVCDAKLFVLKNCLTFLSDFMPVNLKANSEYKAECSSDIRRTRIEFSIIEETTDTTLVKSAKAYQ